jgi:hypothetical protein
MAPRRFALPSIAGIAGCLAAILPEALAEACVMCGTATSPDDPVTRAFSWSVLFLIAMPYTVFGLAAGWLILANRRRSGRRRGRVVVLPRVRPVPAPSAGPEES